MTNIVRRTIIEGNPLSILARALDTAGQPITVGDIYSIDATTYDSDNGELVTTTTIAPANVVNCSIGVCPNRQIWGSD